MGGEVVPKPMSAALRSANRFASLYATSAPKRVISSNSLNVRAARHLRILCAPAAPGKKRYAMGNTFR